jgi:hypothetical protein
VEESTTFSSHLIVPIIWKEVVSAIFFAFCSWSAYLRRIVIALIMSLCSCMALGVLSVNSKSAVTKSLMISMLLLTSLALAIAASVTFDGVSGLLISSGIDLLVGLRRMFSLFLMLAHGGAISAWSSIGILCIVFGFWFFMFMKLVYVYV